MTRIALVSVALVAGLAVAGRTSAQDRASKISPDWQFDITPYLWASGMDGRVGVRDRTAHVDISFRELLDHLEGAAMLAMEARKSRLGFGVEGLYIKVGDDRATPGPLFSGARLQAKQFMGEFGPRYRALQTQRVAMDLLLGARLWRLRNDLTLTQGVLPEINAELNKSWVDGIGGARVFVNLTDRWLLQARGDVGGLSSELTWQALGLVGYSFSRHFTMRAGYRHLDVDFRDDDDGFVFDVGMGGLILGGTISFRHRSRAAAADGH